jgi:hypothetical protein
VAVGVPLFSLPGDYFPKLGDSSIMIDKDFIPKEGRNHVLRRTEKRMSIPWKIGRETQ